MTTKEAKSYNKLIINILRILPNINKRRKDFLVEVFVLLLSIKGRINFLQLSRYGNYKEQRYRLQFEKQFSFLGFNKELVLSSGGGKYAIAFDPSYISKSGKHTPGLGYFWSGCAGRAKWGLEIAGLAAIDTENHTAFHLEAVQTLADGNNDSTLVDWYANIITSRKESLKSISNIVVADAWFSKRKFADQIISAEMNLISRLRDDADLLYLYKGTLSSGKGRPKKYDGKIIHNNLRKNYFALVEQNEQATIYCAQVYSKSLKRIVKLVHVIYKSKKGKEIYKLYFSTDLSLGALEILDYYRTRFQIEFLYRDAKQHTGLNDCQARSENKLNFHFNASLTAINIAKIEHWLSIPKEQRESFSMNDIKTINNNWLQLQRFFDKFGINPYSTKNQIKARELIYHGTIAA
ncbi:transposase [bacterium]|nr:transposase [bacterium]